MQPLQRPAVYNFPPFYTKQRNQQTERQRKEDWLKWVIQWAREKRQTELLVEKETKEGDLFINRSINRQLSTEDAIDILDYMVEKGNGEWAPPGKVRFLVFYKSLAEWARLLYDFVDRTGQTGNVFTVWELLEGDETEAEEFHGLDKDVFMKVLRHMEKEGRAKTFTATDPSKIGVKIV